MKTKTERKKFDYSNKYLRRARHVYIRQFYRFFTSDEIPPALKNIKLEEMADRMMDCGLYAQPKVEGQRSYCNRQIRHRIMAYTSKAWVKRSGESIEIKSWQWHEFCKRFNFATASHGACFQVPSKKEVA